MTNSPFERFTDQVDRHRDAPFLIDAASGVTLTYGQCDSIAQSLASELQRRGVRRADRVALVLHNSPELALLFFACLYLGAVVVPMDPGAHPIDAEDTLRRSRTVLVVGAAGADSFVDPGALHRAGIGFWSVAEGSGSGSRTLADSWSVGQPLPLPPASWSRFDGVTPGDLFTIHFTSGTTNIPKGVAHRISALFSNAAAFNEAVGFDRHTRLLHVFAMTYMAGFLNTLLSPFMAGASVVLAGRFGAQHALNFWAPVRNYDVNALWLAPTMLTSLLRLDRDLSAPDYCRTRMRQVCVGTAPLPLATRAAFEDKYGAVVLESYGLSELLFVTTNSNRITRRDRSVGRPLSGVTIRIGAVQDGAARAAGDGEVSVKTPYCMAGYLNGDTGQPDPMDDEWFPTGDIGHLSADGDLFITGRAKDLIIRGGLNVSPRVIEELLLQHPAVAETAVIGLPHDLWGEEIVGVVRLNAGHTLCATAGALSALCKERLAAGSRPDRFIDVVTFPVGISGKIQKATLRQSVLQRVTQGAT